MKKLNFAEMGRTLTRAEMKQIMAGSGGVCTASCSHDWDCENVSGCPVCDNPDPTGLFGPGLCSKN